MNDKEVLKARFLWNPHESLRYLTSSFGIPRDFEILLPYWGIFGINPEFPCLEQICKKGANKC